MVIWSICLTLFFGFFRLSNVLQSVFDPSSHLRRIDFTCFSWGILVKIRYSKTIQLHQRVVQVPLLKLKRSVLCPFTALSNAFLVTQGSNTMGPAFTIPQKGSFISFSPNSFRHMLKSVLQSLGYSSSEYSAHSFRRGAASWALSVGIPSDLIQVLGDWKSDVYQTFRSW